MPINKEVIFKEIELIKNTLAKIGKMQIDQDDLDSEDTQDLLSFRIQQAIENCIGIASHIIANESLGTINNAKSSFELLSKNNIISQEVAGKLGQAVGMRNVIVHQYDEVDLEKLFQVYKTDKQDIKDFLNQILTYLDQK